MIWKRGVGEASLQHDCSTQLLQLHYHLPVLHLPGAQGAGMGTRCKVHVLQVLGWLCHLKTKLQPREKQIFSEERGCVCSSSGV